MKKILALILVVSCVFALGSCKLVKKIFGKDVDDTPVVSNDDVAPIQAKIDASVPETALVTVDFKSTLGELESTYLVTYNIDGSATVNYTYEKFNQVGESKDFKTTVTGETTIGANGELVNPPAGIAAVEALTFDINLDASKLYSATLTSGILNAVVKAENTLAILGVDLGVDANLVVSVGTLGVASVAISYTTANGTVEIVSTYTYYVAPEEEEGEGEEGEEGSESDEGASA